MARDGARTDTAVVQASPAALEVINRLGAAHGPLMFFQSGGCCDGGSPMCLQDGELPLSPQDVCLGEIGGAPFYIDAAQYESWGRPRLTVDVSPGAAEGFSLEGLVGVHFVTRTEPPPRSP
jgi:uncharacterized protein (DUF779 family)